MRQSTGVGIETSVLGFGCGSVLGRVGRSASLRAMNTAWDEGITLFDTARSYGDGRAESVLGEFLRGKRDQAVVASKFGISPQTGSPLKRMAVPVARAAIRMKVPGVRRLVRRGSASAAQHGHFTVEGLRESLESSLRQLRTDYLDILYLHEASADSMRQLDLMCELEAMTKAGKLRHVGLYAHPAVIAECLAAGPPIVEAMQFGADPFDPLVATLTGLQRSRPLLIGNHPFGGEERVARVRATLKAMSADETVAPELRRKLHNADWQLLLEAMLGVMLEAMGLDALVFSMMRPEHIRANVCAVESHRFTTPELVQMRERLLHSSLPAPMLP